MSIFLLKIRQFGILLALLFGSVFLFLQVYGSAVPIVITEICPTGCASSGYQWVEIYNKSDEDIDLSDWKFFEADTNHGLSVSVSSTIQNGIISAGSYAVIVQNDILFFQEYNDVHVLVLDSSWSALNKSGEEIGLKNENGDSIELFSYDAIDAYSLERVDVDQEVWKEHPSGHSVGVQNYWMGSVDETIENLLPVAIISAPYNVTVGEEKNFSAEDSSDSDGTIVSYEWLFDEEVVSSEMSFSYIFATTGTVNIVLSVTDDAAGVASTTQTVFISDVIVDESITTTTSTDAIVLINEFVSDPVADEHEWIELYNHTSTSVNMADWELHEGAGTSTKKLKTLEGNISAYGYVVIILSSSKLNNSGDLLVLFDDNEQEIDRVAYGDWDDGDVTDNVAMAEDPQSIARIGVGQDTNNDKNDFAITIEPTPSEENIITTPIIIPPVSSGGGGGSVVPIAQIKTYRPRDIVINEIVSDPSDGMEEFVELYNTTDETIVLDTWWIEDGSEAKTVLSGSIVAKGFFVIEKPKGNLNNAGDLIAVFDPTAQEIDRVTYGSWDDGNVSDNAPAPEDPLSLIRKKDGQDSDNDYYDFVLTNTITKEKENVLTQVTQDGQIIEQIIGISHIEISEVFPNPKGGDSEDEFIELYNVGNETVNLAGWKLGDASSKRYSISQGSLQPDNYIVFKRAMTGIALNNTGGDEVKLFSAQDQLLDSVTYVGSAGEDMSYVRDEAGNWVWTTEVTSGKKNIVKGTSAAPQITIDVDTEVAIGQSVVFDASDTTDADGDVISFVWNFDTGDSDTGSVVEYIFEKEGVYTVILEATDSQDNTAKKDIIITVKSISDYVSGYSGGEDVRAIIIFEIFPNPEGSDTTEFIELYNPTDSDIDLSELKLDDEEGGSRAYRIPDKTIITSHEYKIFGRQDTGLALNNTSDAVRILYPDGSVIAEVRYDDVLEAHSYIKNDEGVWVWTSVVTPGKENIIALPKEVKGTKISKKSKYVKPIINATLATIRHNDIGDQVKLTGIVAVEPGVLGTQYFYMTDDVSTTPSGVQIYMYSKQFPKLEIGDRVEVMGEVSETGGETRIKTKEKKDIVKIDHVGSPQALVVDIVDVGENVEGALIKINGEITELKGSYMYVDDGTEEVKVYFKRGAGIQKEVLQEGDVVSVVGLVHQTKSGYQLLPRTQYDIVKTGVAESFVRTIEKEDEADAQDLAEKYLTATAGGLTALFVGLFGKMNGKKVGTWFANIFMRLFKRRDEDR